MLAALPAMAEDWTVNGKDYHNVKVGVIEADRVHITYDGGIGTVAFADLSPELQKRFGYDSEKAKDAARAEAARLAKLNSDPIVQAQRKAIKVSQVRYVEVNQVLPDGLLVSPLSAVIDDGYANYHRSDRMVFIHSKFNSIVDGDRIAVRVYRSGTYSYQSALGAARTVEEWTAVVPFSTDSYMIWGTRTSISISEPVAP